MTFSNYFELVGQNEQDTSKYILIEEKEGMIHAELAMQLDSIRLILNNKNHRISKFELILYNDTLIIKKYNFQGSVAPNIFKEYNRLFYLDDNNVEHSKDLSHFIIKATILDIEMNIEFIKQKIIYFYVTRGCINASKINNAAQQ